MCGRFYILVETEDGMQTQMIFPTQEAKVLTRDGWCVMRWGFPKPEGGVYINARAETVAVKPTFRSSFAARRCLVPAQGFYEWQRISGKKTKDRYKISARDDEKIMMAGIFNEQGCFVIITQPPNEVVAPLHDRMPVVFPTEELQRLWLHEDGLAESLLEIRPDTPMRAEHDQDEPAFPDIEQQRFDEALFDSM